MCEDRVLFVWVVLHVSLRGQQHLNCEREILVEYPHFVRKLRSSFNPTNKNLTDFFHCFTMHFNSLNLTHQLMHFYIQSYITLSKPSRCVFNTVSKILTSYTTINIKIHTIKWYKFIMATCFGRLCKHYKVARSVKVGPMIVARATETCCH